MRDKTRVKGAYNHWIGVVTGDREQEAKGLVQERTGHDPSRVELDRVTRLVRRAHHDFGDGPRLQP